LENTSDTIQIWFVKPELNTAPVFTYEKVCENKNYLFIKLYPKISYVLPSGRDHNGDYHADYSTDYSADYYSGDCSGDYSGDYSSAGYSAGGATCGGGGEQGGQFDSTQ
jgi:hypothetical protein